MRRLLRRWTLLAGILPDRRFDVAISQRDRGLFVGSHLVSLFVEVKLALTAKGEPTHRSQGKREAAAVAGVPKRTKQRE